MPTRAWELLAGGILAKLESDWGRRSHPILCSIMPLLGICLIFYSIAFFDSGTLHPSYLTLLPIIGTMLPLWFCKQGEFVSNILASKPFVAIGLISYGFYLWHYPVFAFARFEDDHLSQFDKVELVTLSAVLAITSYFIIEKPFRRPNIILNKSLLIFISVMFSLIFSFALSAYIGNGILGRYEDWQLKYIGTGITGNSDFSHYVDRHFDTHIKDRAFAKNQKRKLLLIGDSYSKDFYNVLREKDYLVNIDVSAHIIPSRCKNVPSSVNVENQIRKIDISLCSDISRVGDEILNQRIIAADIVIFSSSWDDFTAEHVTKLQQKVYELGVERVLVVGRKRYPQIPN